MWLPRSRSGKFITSTVPEQELRSSCVNSWMGTALGKDGYCRRNCNHIRDGEGPRYGYSPIDSDNLKDCYHPNDGYNSRDGDQ